MLQIGKRMLTRAEQDIISREIRKFRNPVYFSRKHWEEVTGAYVAEEINGLAGICGISPLKQWIKLGPFVVLAKYQGKGIGKQIMQTAVNENKNKYLFIGSRNHAVWAIAENFGFREKSVIALPWEVQQYLLGTSKWFLDPEYIRELIRKNSASEGPYRCFIKRK